MRLFRESVHATCSGDYMQQQLAAWSPAESQNIDTWSTRFAVKKLFVARVVEANITALPFFVRHDFSVVLAQEVGRSGERLKNFVMERFLGA